MKLSDYLDEKIDQIEDYFMDKEDEFEEWLEHKYEDMKIENKVDNVKEGINNYFKDKDAVVKCIIFSGGAVTQAALFHALIAADILTAGRARAIQNATRHSTSATKEKMWAKFLKTRRITDIFSDL